VCAPSSYQCTAARDTDSPAPTSTSRPVAKGLQRPPRTDQVRSRVKCESFVDDPLLRRAERRKRIRLASTSNRRAWWYWAVGCGGGAVMWWSGCAEVAGRSRNKARRRRIEQSCCGSENASASPGVNERDPDRECRTRRSSRAGTARIATRALALRAKASAGSRLRGRNESGESVDPSVRATRGAVARREAFEAPG
jgi:hypothetical protein